MVSKDKQSCAVPSCKSSRYVTSHRLPKDEIRREKWIKAINSPLLSSLSREELNRSRFGVCNLHFRKEDYMCSLRPRLKDEAVPVLNLSQEFEYKENEIAKSNVHDDSSIQKSTIDVDLDAESSTLVNVCEENIEFSPLNYRHWVSSSPRCSKVNKNVASGSNSGSGEFAERKIKKEFAENMNVDEGASSVPEAKKQLSFHSGVKVRPSKPLIWKRNKFTFYKIKFSMYRYENRLRKFSENASTSEFSEHVNKLSALQRHFIQMILRNAERHKNSRQFNDEEKLICLSIFKRSAVTYRYLCTILPLPSPNTVKKILRNIKLDTGVSTAMRNCLKETAERMADPKDKVCLLMWDQVSLKLMVEYSADKDKVIGFEDWGTNRTNKFADHALVFMLRGIDRGWKIPLSYNFCVSQTKEGQLARCIKEVVRAVTEAGFNIVATVCDQGASNMKAIKSLQLDTDKIREEKNITRYWTILIDDVEIVPLYDPPHLLKCVRNNLLTKDLEYEVKEISTEQSRRYANWKHVVRAYEIDLYAPRLNRMVPDLTDYHVYPDKINKMSVKLMMQVFSKKLASFMDLLSLMTEPIRTSVGPMTMPPEAFDTAFLLNFFNDVADGFNGVQNVANHPRRIPWSDTSYHDIFFQSAARQIKSMWFVDKKSREPVKTDIPCLKNLSDTLEGFRLVARTLKTLGFDSFAPRNINQDPLENFFGCVKSHDFMSNKPTCSQFESIFKSLLITNLSSKHSPGYNCEEDKGMFIIDSKTLLLGNESNENDEEQSEDDIDDEEEFSVNVSNEARVIPEKGHFYSDTSSLVKKLKAKLPEVISCADCSASFQKESKKRQNSTCFKDMNLDAKNVLGKILSENLSSFQICKKAKRWLKIKINFTFFSCLKHKNIVFKLFSHLCVQKYMFSTFTYVNRILKGRIVPRNTNLCPALREARERYLKTVRKDRRQVLLRENRLGFIIGKNVKCKVIKSRIKNLKVTNNKPNS